MAAVDGRQGLVAQGWQDDPVEGLADLLPVLGAPAGAGFDDPEFGELGESGGRVVGMSAPDGSWRVFLKLGRARTVGKQAGVVKGALADLLVDPPSQRLHQLPITRGIGKGGLLLAPHTPVVEVEVQRSCLRANADLSHGPPRH